MGLPCSKLLRCAAFLGTFGTVLSLGAVLQPASANCYTARLFQSVDEFQNYSYVYTPGFYPSFPAYTSSSVSLNAKGSFWVLGNGDPALGPGNDNGSWAAIGSDGYAGSYYAGWLVFRLGFGAVIDGTWARTQEIDGCPDIVGHPVCMAIMLTDAANNIGYFAMLTDEADNLRNYDFVQPGNAPINLAPIPKPAFTNCDSSDPNSVVLEIAGPILDGGVYLDPSCSGIDEIVSYKVFSQILPRGAPPPSDRDISAGWVDVSGVIPWGMGTNVVLDCIGDTDVYLATGLLFDSGFETPYVSENSTRVGCGPNGSCECSDGDGDGITECQGDCNDADETSWATPGEVLGVVFSSKTEIEWRAPLEPGGSAIEYDTIGSRDASDFVTTRTCVESNDGADTRATEAAPIAVGVVRYYLVRAENACPSGAGPLGTDSTGNPRSAASCP